jgi:hypothetical protein
MKMDSAFPHHAAQLSLQSQRDPALQGNAADAGYGRHIAPQVPVARVRAMGEGRIDNGPAIGLFAASNDAVTYIGVRSQERRADPSDCRISRHRKV